MLRLRFPFSALAIALTTLAAVAAASVYAATSPAHRRPNILLILADDMGFSDLGCYGSEIATPHLDRLAARGLRFTQFYNGARCNPTRAALLTGLYAHQAGMGYATGNFKLPAYQGHLSRESVTIAEALRPAGYATLMSGKWHVGDHRPEWPIDRGFDRFYGLVDGAGSYWEILPGNKRALDDRPLPVGLNEGGAYLTDALTDYAIKFLNDSAPPDRPFFLYLAYTAPHYPLHARPDDIAKYRGKYKAGWDAIRAARYKKQLELGLVDAAATPLAPREKDIDSWDDTPAAEKDLWDLRMAVYAAMIERMDHGIGRVLAELEKQGRRDDTLVMFLSDNGGCHLDPSFEKFKSSPDIPPGVRNSYWGYGPNWANVSNTPFRKFKQHIHEGGIATPLVCSWPAGLRNPGRIDRQPGHIVDIMATALDLAGVPYPKAAHGRALKPLAGLSLAPAFRGERRPVHEFLFWEHVGNRGVRSGDWKLVADRDREWELYDLSTDRTELHNRAAAMPAKVKELAARYDRWAKDAGVVSWSVIQAKKQKK